MTTSATNPNRRPDAAQNTPTNPRSSTNDTDLVAMEALMRFEPARFLSVVSGFIAIDPSEDLSPLVRELRTIGTVSARASAVAIAHLAPVPAADLPDTEGLPHWLAHLGSARVGRAHHATFRAIDASVILVDVLLPGLSRLSLYVLAEADGSSVRLARLIDVPFDALCQVVAEAVHRSHDERFTPLDENTLASVLLRLSAVRRPSEHALVPLLAFLGRVATRNEFSSHLSNTTKP